MDFGPFFKNFVAFLKTKDKNSKFFIVQSFFSKPDANRIFIFTAPKFTVGIVVNMSVCQNVYPGSIP